ncbi:MAG: metalloendopeptidase [Alishewanella sp. 34-51-39]|nr:MAG: metalloendopeptidase [Alishewanella sp. 34-51-39]
MTPCQRLPVLLWFSRIALLLCLIVLTACAGRSAPAPVTTLELRKQHLAQRQQAELSGNQYIVQRGDTLYSIAFRAGQDYRTLASRNNIRPPYTIYPGQVLRLQAQRGNPVTRSVTALQGKTTTPRQNTKSVATAQQKGYGQVTPVAQPEPAGASAVANRVRWQWPVRGPILARFSTAENGIKGLQIGGRDGNRVNAAADGQVVYAGSALRGYGNLVIIKHNDDYLSAYAHNKRLLVKERQEVKAGQQIAEMGDTDAASTRLHFEIRFRGKSVDPLRYLPK